MKDTIFYDRDGTPVAYTDDNRHIFLFDGTPVAYLHEGSFYSYEGVHLGVYEDGWVRDNGGHCVFFQRGAYGGPLRPGRKMTPNRAIKQVIPVKKDRQVKPARFTRTTIWSNLSSVDFFKQEKTPYGMTVLPVAAS